METKVALGDMKVGIVFPQYEIDADGGAIKAFAQAAEELGFDYIVFYDHVVGQPPFRNPDNYDHTYNFHEPLVTSGFMAGVTSRIGFSQGVLILAQRQTVLMAKQAAQVDVLSGGRLRIVGGTGYQKFEYEALDISEHYDARGARSAEQIEVMRALWTQDYVTFKGRFHNFTDIGMRPQPVQRPIPIWLGGHIEAVYKRAAKLADGFTLSSKSRVTNNQMSLAEARDVRLRLDHHLKAAGRDPASFGYESRVAIANWRNSYATNRSVPRVIDTEPEECAALLAEWAAVGATHMYFSTIDAGFSTVDQHVAYMRRFAQARRKM